MELFHKQENTRSHHLAIPCYPYHHPKMTFSEHWRFVVESTWEWFCSILVFHVLAEIIPLHLPSPMEPCFFVLFLHSFIHTIWHLCWQAGCDVWVRQLILGVCAVQGVVCLYCAVYYCWERWAEILKCVTMNKLLNPMWKLFVMSPAPLQTMGCQQVSQRKTPPWSVS